MCCMCDSVDSLLSGQPPVLPTGTETLSPDASWIMWPGPSCPAGSAAGLESEFRGEYHGAADSLPSFTYC